MSAKLHEPRAKGREDAERECQRLASQLLAWRTHRGLTYRGLGIRACIRPQVVTAIEERDSDPLYSTIVRLAKGLDITVYELLFVDPRSSSGAPWL